MKRFSYSLTRKKISVRLSTPCLKAVDTLVVGVGTPQSCGLRKTVLEFVRQYEPTDAGGLGIDKCVLFAQMSELVYEEVSKTSALTGVWVQVPLWAPDVRTWLFVLSKSSPLPTNNCGIRSACRRVVFRPAYLAP